MCISFLSARSIVYLEIDFKNLNSVTVCPFKISGVANDLTNLYLICNHCSKRHVSYVVDKYLYSKPLSVIKRIVVCEIGLRIEEFKILNSPN